MGDQSLGPSGFDWLGIVWSSSEQRGEVTLNSQLVDAKSLAIATNLQAVLGSTRQQFAHKACAPLGCQSGDDTIAHLIGFMSNVTSTNASAISVVNAMVANAQQDQSLNTQTAGQGVQMSSNQVTEVDSTNQTNVMQLLGALVNQQNSWGGFQLN